MPINVEKNPTSEEKEKGPSKNKMREKRNFCVGKEREKA